MRAALAALSVLLVLAGVAVVVHRALVPRPALDLTPSAAPPPAAPPPRETGVIGGGPRVDPDWVERTARRGGLPSTALRAYAQASLAPVGECRVGWTTLAAIGWVESRHGTLGGRGLGADGRSTTPILGPALDGTGGFAAIRATPEGTVLHGDRVWEHAVGPMQFLPETWAAWAADGDGDGTADPADLDDAAAAAARYLCAGGRDLATGAGWSSGVLSYNRSTAYVADVRAAATAYAERTRG